MRTCKNTNPFYKSFLIAILALTLSVSTSVLAAGKHSGGHEHASGDHASDSAAIGQPGKALDVTHTVTVTMTDNRYEPERISVKKGETIRFVVQNEGIFVHEFNIGTAKMHKAHQKEMMMMFEYGVLELHKINHARMKMDMGGGKTMEHNDPNSVLLEPKNSAEIIWRFDMDGMLEFACNVPGHYESGMVGKITIQ